NILRLPNELLEQIVKFLRPSTTMHVLAGAGFSFVSSDFKRSRHGDTPETLQYVSEVSNLRNVAMTCTRLLPIVERVLYRDIRLPLRALRYCHPDGIRYPYSLTCLLARTLFKRTDLAARVVSLEIWFQDRRLVSNTKQTLLPSDGPHFDVFSQACAKVSALSIDWKERGIWLSELSSSGEMALQAVLIGSLPNLQKLKFFSSTTFWDWNKSHPLIRSMPMPYERPYLDLALRYSGLTSLTIASHLPVRAFPVHSLAKLHLDINFFAGRLEWLDSPLMLPNVNDLSIIANHIGPYRTYTTLYWPSVSTPPIREGLLIFLKNSVPNVTTFAIETPTGPVPMKAGDFGLKEDNLPVLRLDDPQDIEFHPLYDRWSDANTWSWLTTTITPLKPLVNHFALPLNWYSSGFNTPPFSGLQGFVKLQSLHVPKVALRRSRLAEDFNEDDEAAAIDCLPRSLRSLVVSQVDFDTCKWIQEMLVQSNEFFPDLKDVRLVFGNEPMPIVPPGFTEAVQQAGAVLTAQWKDEVRVVK
ncbi:hypothetical protein EJ07DRAFT_134259, partial [Lizonia empirigonia]